jgi:hypothetical protein
MREAGFDLQCRRPRCFGRLERALRLPVYLEQIAFRLLLILLGALFFWLFPLRGILCRHSEGVPRHDHSLLLRVPVGPQHRSI